MDPTTHVQLSMRSDALDPDEVTRTLGVSPTWAFRKGDEFRSQGRVRLRPWGVWAVSSEQRVDSPKLEDHIRYLLQLFEGKTESVRQIKSRAGFSVQVYLWHVGYGAFSVSSDLLERICRLCECVNVTVFEVDVDPESPSDPE
jgi:hypothetical protein